MINVGLGRFHKCLGRFEMLTFQGCSKAGRFKHLSKHVFHSLQFQKYIRYESHRFFQDVWNLRYISKMEKKFKKNFFNFFDNSIWIRLFNFQMLQREYLSSEENVLTKSCKSSNITNKRGFLSQCLSEIQRNLIKVLSWRFDKCLGPSNMLTVEWWY